MPTLFPTKGLQSGGAPLPPDLPPPETFASLVEPKFEDVPIEIAEAQARLYRRMFFAPITLPSDWNPNYHLEHDGEWEAFMPHEVVEFNGHVVPLFPRPGDG